MVKKWKWAVMILGCIVWLNPSISTANHIDYQNGYYAGRCNSINTPIDTTRCKTSYIYPAHSPANTRDWNEGYMAGLRSHMSRNTIAYQTKQLQMQTGYLTELSPSIKPYKQPIVQPSRPGIHPLPMRPGSNGIHPIGRPDCHSAYGFPKRHPVSRPLDRPTHPGTNPFWPYPCK